MRLEAPLGLLEGERRPVKVAFSLPVLSPFQTPQQTDGQPLAFPAVSSAMSSASWSQPVPAGWPPTPPAPRGPDEEAVSDQQSRSADVAKEKVTLTATQREPRETYQHEQVLKTLPFPKARNSQVWSLERESITEEENIYMGVILVSESVPNLAGTYGWDGAGGRVVVGCVWSDEEEGMTPGK